MHPCQLRKAGLLEVNEEVVVIVGEDVLLKEVELAVLLELDDEELFMEQEDPSRFRLPVHSAH